MVYDNLPQGLTLAVWGRNCRNCIWGVIRLEQASFQNIEFSQFNTCTKLPPPIFPRSIYKFMISLAIISLAELTADSIPPARNIIDQSFTQNICRQKNLGGETLIRVCYGSDDPPSKMV